jgi:hypothetical protein
LLYNFLRNLQVSAKHQYYLRNCITPRPLDLLKVHKYALGSQKSPWKKRGENNLVLEPWRVAARRKFGGSGGGAGCGRGGGGV